jgi:acyl-coenzyme A synthetase/AMP-(fatty) acid ligase
VPLSSHNDHAIGGETLGEGLLDWGRDTFGLTINEFYGQVSFLAPPLSLPFPTFPSPMTYGQFYGRRNATWYWETVHRS